MRLAEPKTSAASSSLGYRNRKELPQDSQGPACFQWILAGRPNAFCRQSSSTERRGSCLRRSLRSYAEDAAFARWDVARRHKSPIHSHLRDEDLETTTELKGRCRITSLRLDPTSSSFPAVKTQPCCNGTLSHWLATVETVTLMPERARKLLRTCCFRQC